MSYRRGLGQVKPVPGQIAFQQLPAGQTALPSLEPLVRAGLPIAPYIEHGSWEFGQPAIMRYGLDPYRGIMGLGQGPMYRTLRRSPRRRRRHVATAMGQVLTEWACEPTTFAAAWRDRMNLALNAGTQAAVIGGVAAGIAGAAVKRPLIGALLGAAFGWTAHATWTAIYRP